MNRMKPYKTLILASSGAGLEWFDFTIYILLAHYISQVFFPESTPIVALLKTFGTFAIGYLARPIGGIVFGHIADRHGRKYAFTTAVFTMAIATLFIGFIPSFNSIGVWAPTLLVLLRLVQGFSVGGEIPSATVFTLEHFNKKHAGFAVGIIFMSITFGNALASLLGWVLTHIFHHAQMLAWGWRIAFYCGFVLGIASYFLRKKALETPAFQQLVEQQAIRKLPIMHLLKTFKTKLFIGIGLAVIIAAGIFTFLYLPTYAVNFLHYQHNEIFLAATIFFTLTGLLCPVFGFLSDCIGRKKQLLVGTLVCIVVGFFLFHALIHHARFMPWGFAIGMAIIFAINNSIYALMIAETFKTNIRTSGLGFCYNIAFAVFGGLAPLLITFLIHETQNVFLPYYYFLGCAILTLVAAMCYKKCD